MSWFRACSGQTDDGGDGIGRGRGVSGPTGSEFGMPDNGATNRITRIYEWVAIPPGKEKGHGWWWKVYESTRRRKHKLKNALNAIL